MDVLSRLLLSSNPLITSIRLRPKKNTKTFSKEFLEMLIAESFSPLTKDSVTLADVECIEVMNEDSDDEFLVDEEWAASPKH
ncbi:hypothetical protein ILUMI_26921 [Ignelater luminosus]|uniref:Uncharacterized protein n=1 Tax=Ignelater luminosus TaxID=2038154 RepID=A0A8K0C3Z4_IGNLU|nr:hypothetical protein ILUMI_26921 [Ignelater luminosus]